MQAMEFLPSGLLICYKGQKMETVLTGLNITGFYEASWHKYMVGIPFAHLALGHTCCNLISELPLPRIMSDPSK